MNVDEGITKEEILAAIDAMTSGKHQVQMGPPYTVDINETFKENLISTFFDMLLKAFQIGLLPVSVRGALFKLLPKPGKVTQDMKICVQ